MCNVTGPSFWMWTCMNAPNSPPEEEGGREGGGGRMLTVRPVRSAPNYYPSRFPGSFPCACKLQRDVACTRERT